MKNIIYNIYNSPIDKLKRKTLIASYEQGGYKMIDIKSQNGAIKIGWMKRLITTERLARKEKGIMQWRHKRLFNTLPECCEDGTHMDTEEGKERYKISIYGAIRETVRQIRRGCDLRRGRKSRKQWCNTTDQNEHRPVWQQVARGTFNYEGQGQEMYN